jgi:hypothetical protein
MLLISDCTRCVDTLHSGTLEHIHHPTSTPSTATSLSQKMSHQVYIPLDAIMGFWSPVSHCDTIDRSVGLGATSVTTYIVLERNDLILSLVGIHLHASSIQVTGGDVKVAPSSFMVELAVSRPVAVFRRTSFVSTKLICQHGFQLYRTSSARLHMYTTKYFTV